MAEPPSHKDYSGLPPEVKGIVFDFIRTVRDQCNVCLVSHEWRQLMLPYLWRLLRIHLGSLNNSRKVSTLLNQKGGILPHVRVLSLYNDARIVPTLLHSFKRLLDALPRNNLLAFNTELGLIPSFIIDILRSHSGLQSLGMPVANFTNTPVFLRGTTSIIPQVAKLKTMSIMLPEPDNTPNQVWHDEVLFMLKHASSLENLRLGGRKFRDHYVFCAKLASTFTGRPLVLKHLSLVGINIAWYSVNTIDCSALTSLQLLECWNTRTFILDVGASLQGNPSCLKKVVLDIQFDPRFTDDALSIQNMLESFTGLEELAFGSLELYRTAKQSIIRHSATLVSLTLSYSPLRTQPPMVLADITGILQACKKLQQVGLRLPVERIHFYKTFDFFYQLNQQQDSLIAALAALPELHTFYMVDRLNVYFEACDRPMNNNRLQNLKQTLALLIASTVIQRMVGLGSPVRYVRFAKRTFTRGKLTLRDGTEVVVSKELSGDPLEEMPQSTILLPRFDTDTTHRAHMRWFTESDLGNRA